MCIGVLMDVKKDGLQSDYREDGLYQAVYTTDISTFWQGYGLSAKRVLIDMPIGLSSDREGRLTESHARKILKGRTSSVFSVPTREAIEEGAKAGFDSETYKIACDINRKIEGKAFSKQSWNISAKIHELDHFLREHPHTQRIIHESHPELLFWALNKKQAMRYSKKTGPGFMERVAIIEQYQDNAMQIIRDTYDEYSKLMLDDDIVDALVCALCARLGNLLTVPEHPKQDRYGLLMQMLYPEV